MTGRRLRATASGTPARKVPAILRTLHLRRRLKIDVGAATCPARALIRHSTQADRSMTKFWNEYHLPASLEDALVLLERYQGRARVVAGGTDLLLDFQDAYYSGARTCWDALVDVTRIAGANAIRDEGDWITVGCGVTHTQVVESLLIQSRAAALAQACSVVGGPQVRNVATLVGNIAHALPAADGLIALLVLEAEARVASHAGAPADWRPLASLYKGPGVSAVDATREMIAAIRFRPTGEHEASAFTRVMRPQGVALPILGMAARVRTAAGRRIEDVAISAGPVAPLPFRARRTEHYLRGKVLNEETLAEATHLLSGEAAPRTSAHRATTEYRFELLPALLRDVVARAVEQAAAS
jgi:CO/xanthine dehydrogenase FAD-binding subunit